MQLKLTHPSKSSGPQRLGGGQRELGGCWGGRGEEAEQVSGLITDTGGAESPHVLPEPPRCSSRRAGVVRSKTKQHTLSRIRPGSSRPTAPWKGRLPERLERR